MNKIKMILDAAAHAPHEIPEWFKANLPSEPKAPMISIKPELEKLVRDWIGDPCWTLSQYEVGEKMIWYRTGGEYGVEQEKSEYALTADDVQYLAGIEEVFDLHWADHQKWAINCERERYFQWRVFYAQELFARVLEAIDKEDFEGVA